MATGLNESSGSLAIFPTDTSVFTGKLCRTLKFRYKWSVRSFLTRNEKIGEKISPPVFSTDPLIRAKWRLDVFPRGDSIQTKDYVSMHLIPVSGDVSFEDDIKVTFSILNSKGERMILSRADQLFKENRFIGWGWPEFVHRTVIFRWENGLLIKDILNIVCDVTISQQDGVSTPTTPDSIVSERLFSPGPVPGHPLEDLGILLKHPHPFCDIVLIADGKKFYAHKPILFARSAVFRALFDPTSKHKELLDANISKTKHVTDVKEEQENNEEKESNEGNPFEDEVKSEESREDEHWEEVDLKDNSTEKDDNPKEELKSDPIKKRISVRISNKKEEDGCEIKDHSEMQEMNIPDMKPEVLEQMLIFIYTGEIPKLESLGRYILIAADAYGVNRLKTITQTALIRQISINNVMELLQLSDLYGADMLKTVAIRFINNHSVEVMDTPGWKMTVVAKPHLLEELFAAQAGKNSI